MAYIAQKQIMVQSLGKEWRKGQQIGDDALPPDVLAAMLAEGVIAPLVEAPAAPVPKPMPSAPIVDLSQKPLDAKDAKEADTKIEGEWKKPKAARQ